MVYYSHFIGRLTSVLGNAAPGPVTCNPLLIRELCKMSNILAAQGILPRRIRSNEVKEKEFR